MGSKPVGKTEAKSQINDKAPLSGFYPYTWWAQLAPSEN